MRFPVWLSYRGRCGICKDLNCSIDLSISQLVLYLFSLLWVFVFCFLFFCFLFFCLLAFNDLYNSYYVQKKPQEKKNKDGLGVRCRETSRVHCELNSVLFSL